jgi:hypothetical protein
LPGRGKLPGKLLHAECRVRQPFAIILMPRPRSGLRALKRKALPHPPSCIGIPPANTHSGRVGGQPALAHAMHGSGRRGGTGWLTRAENDYRLCLVNHAIIAVSHDHYNNWHQPKRMLERMTRDQGRCRCACVYSTWSAHKTSDQGPMTRWPLRVRSHRSVSTWSAHKTHVVQRAKRLFAVRELHSQI